jgi:anaerobic ribonucleoside-triphosphate reductase activating protein
MVRVSRVHYPVTALGPGSRLGLWVQGCTLACAGCMSRDTWSAAGGRELSTGDLEPWWREALRDGASGLTVSGGEPLQQAERVAELLAMAARVRSEVSATADILLYTGYAETEFGTLGPAAQEAVGHADAVVVGRYRVQEPTRLIWRGSANQRLIPLTPLGRERYAPYLDLAPQHPPMQVLVDDTDIRLIGVPPAGGLTGLEKNLHAAGIGFKEVTWRP